MFDSTVQAEATINVPIEHVFDFLTSPEKVPLVLPGLIEVRNVPDEPLRVGSQFDYVYRLFEVNLEGAYTVTAIEPPVRYEAQSSGGGVSEWSYRLEPRDGGTHVSLTVEYETPQSVAEKVRAAAVQTLNQREANEYLTNLKTVLELQDA
jgi:carbon monoxide dehydrogenase subunit G